jgi:hypothetical protein
MKGHLDEDRKFFLDIIDDLVSSAVSAEQISQMTREDWAEYERRHKDELNEFAATTDNPPALEEQLKVSIEQRRKRMSSISDGDLLWMRRGRAQSICRYMLQVGHLHDGFYSMMLQYEMEHVRIMDAEIARRGLGRDQAPGKSRLIPNSGDSQ